jgi:conserved oligomeric Golgi complex subunit 5
MILDAEVGDQVAQASATLQLLLNEDAKLVSFGLTNASSSPDQVAFPYAASLLEEIDDDNDGTYQSTQEKANLALRDVDRKLALAESLSLKLSRTSPEAVAGHLLCLYGYQIPFYEKDTAPSLHPQGNTTLEAIRERSERLERQAESLETVARRVENSLLRGLTKTEIATVRLGRILKLSCTLKKIMLLQFETSKLQTYELDDMRDLTRAAASVSILEDLLKDPDLSESKVTNHRVNIERIAVVEILRPLAVERAAAVRNSASVLLNELMRQYSEASTISEAGTTQMIQQLGATLQVYYHLGEMHAAVWKSVKHAHAQAEKATRKLFNSVNLTALNDLAKKSVKEPKLAQKKLSQLREELAQSWADSIIIATTFVRNIHRVLCRKTDHGRRVSYIDVIAGRSIPDEYARFAPADKKTKNFPFSLFQLFWARFCNSMFEISESILKQDGGRYCKDVAELYPSVRSASLGIVAYLLQSGSSSGNLGPFSTYEDSSKGILGGTLFLEDENLLHPSLEFDDKRTKTTTARAADFWTVSSGVVNGEISSEHSQVQRDSVSSSSILSLSINSTEWLLLDGTTEMHSGLYLLKQSFVDSCFGRLCEPLLYMFPNDNIGIDSDGVAISSSLSLLPSKYDIQRFDETIRKELALANIKGGDDLTLVSTIAETVVSMISEFCVRANSAMSGVDGETKYVLDDLSISDSLERDRKVVAIMYAVRNYLEQAAEKTFTPSGRPSGLPLRHDAIKVCEEGLYPALLNIDRSILDSVILPLCKALNRRIYDVLTRISHGVYLEIKNDTDEDSPGFIHSYVVPLLESISKIFLSRFPVPFAIVITERLVSFTIYTYLSSVSLVRVVGESTRLRMTQDLTDLEMALEQVVSKVDASLSLSRIENGKPYSELRAVRHMLFWTGLQQNKDWSAQDIAKSLLREFWIKDVRASTLFHYLFSFGPSLLSSPHHAKRIKAEEYVSTLVQFDGSVMPGEDSAWIVIMGCCDSYQQRASTLVLNTDGDPRIARIVLALGQELLRRKQI